MMVIIDDDNGDDDDDDDEDDADDDDDDDDDDDTLVSISHHNRCRPALVKIGFKGSVRPDWRCRRCVVMIIIMTVGDAEDAR